MAATAAVGSETRSPEDQIERGIEATESDRVAGYYRISGVPWKGGAVIAQQRTVLSCTKGAMKPSRTRGSTVADDAHSGPGDVPGVDMLAFLAEGFFPTHALRRQTLPSKRPCGRRWTAPAKRARAMTSSPGWRRRRSRPSRRTSARHRARRRASPPSRAAFRVALPKMGARKTHPDIPDGQPEGRLRLPELRLAVARRRAAPLRVLRERREGDGRRRHAPARSAGVLRAHVRRRARGAVATTGSTRRGGSTRADGAAARARTHYEPIAWDEAFDADRRASCDALADARRARRSTPRAATSNEAAFLYQLFVRQFGTNNLPDCSNMCHESSGTALDREPSASARAR